MVLFEENHETMQLREVASGGQSVKAFLLDMIEAFDRVSHRRLMAKIESYGIMDAILAPFSL